MSLKTIMQTDLQVIENDLDNPTFTYQGEDFVCSPGGDTESYALEAGGFALAADKVLVVRKDVFTDGIIPKQKELITFDSKEYRIAKVVDNVNSAFIKLVLVAPNLGV